MPQYRARTPHTPAPSRLMALGSLWLLAGLGLVVSGCPDGGSTPCAEACSRGFVCDTDEGRCVQAQLPPTSRPPAGRAARVAASGAHIAVAAIDPDLSRIIVGTLDTDQQADSPLDELDWRELAPLTGDVAQKRIALAASGGHLALAWLGSEGRYEIAHRPDDGDPARWSFETAAPIGQSYRGTEFFDLAIGAGGELHLAFQERDHTLRRLVFSSGDAEGDGEAAGWRLETVDEGQSTGEAVDCPQELRNSGDPPGVGIDPDLLLDDDAAWIAYYDGDCGDLRVARFDGSRWSVAIVDDGDWRGVGRYPSLAIDPERRLAVAYHDVSRGQLWYARLEEDGWSRELVDPGLELDAASRRRKQLVGAFATLSTDDRGALAITYLNATTTELRIARRASPDQPWSQRTVAGDGVVGFFADHAWTAQSGRTIVAERLVPGPDGLSSELFIAREEP